MAGLSKIEMTHPSGKFTVTVDSYRAEILRARGYTPTGNVEHPEPKPRARRLNA